MARIVVTDPLPEEALSYLAQRGHEVVPCGADDGATTEAEAWVVRSGTHLDAPRIQRAGRLRAIGRAGVGVDNIDLDAATRQGVAVFHSPSGNITSAAEQAFALMLAVARRVPEADRSMKEGRWERGKLQGTELYGKTLLVVGLGRIGRMLADRARAFGMQVIAHDPFVTPEQAHASGVEWVALEDGLRKADVVSLHTPLTPQTRELIDARRLAAMKDDAILVNAARGPLVDPEALLEALEQGRLRGAGIDVWPEEPPSDWQLARHPRVVAAPHLGASTAEAQSRAALEACARLCDFLETGDAGLAVNAHVRVAAELRPWVGLAESLAAFAVQTLDGTLQEIVLAVDPTLDQDALRVHTLVGALKAGMEGPVNAINAPQAARERGWVVSVRPLPPAEPPAVRVEARADGRLVSVEGTYTPHYGARVTRLNGHDVEFRPRGRFLVTHHDDVPGVLAAIAHVLADARVNVATVSLARDAAARDAVAVIQIDGPIPKAARDALRRLEHVRGAHRVRLD